MLTLSGMINYENIFFVLEFMKFHVFLFSFCSNSVAAESALDRLSVVLGGKTMLPHITTNIPPMLQSSE